MSSKSPSRTTDLDGQPVDNTEGDLISEQFPVPAYVIDLLRGDGTPSSLSERIAVVMGELSVLQREVAALPSFLGKFHAENGLRQAGVYTNDCLHRLQQNTPEQS